MVTYEELFLLGTLLVSIIALVIDITKKEITALVKAAVISNN